MVFERKKCYCKLWAIEKSLCRDYVKVESCLVQELCLLKKKYYCEPHSVTSGHRPLTSSSS
jgi:hypothetical protein